MLTHNDRTIENALECASIAINCGIRHIGFKDIGLPESDLRELSQYLLDHNVTRYLEVVSLDADEEQRSVESGLRIGVDRLMGGTRPDLVLPLIKDSDIGYYPFPGNIVGHPSRLTGTVQSIVEDAVDLSQRDGVTGLDLLAYRFSGQVETLMGAVCQSVNVPVVMAGSVDSPARIRAVKASGAAGFTIGTAALEGVFEAEDTGLYGQLKAILSCL